MRKILFLIAALAVAFGVRADDNFRLWESGALRWDEFRGVPALENSPSYIGIDIVMSTRDGQDGTFSMAADAVFCPDRSYAPDEARTDRQLRYMQARFDLAEIMSRRLQAELGAGVSGIEADRRLTYYRNLLRTEADKLASATHYGTDEKQLQLWEYDIRRALEELESSPSVSMTLNPWSYGLYVGIGGIFPTGNITDVFSPACSFTFGIQGGWRRIRLEGAFSYAIPSLRDQTLVESQYASAGYHANVKTANYLGIGFGAGYAVLDTKRFSIAPYLGGQWTSCSWTSRPMGTGPDDTLSATGLQQRMQLDDFNLTFGVHFEWHFHSVVTSFPMFGSMREQYVSSLCLTPFATRAVYTDAAIPYSGWQIGFMVSYSGVARALGIK